MQLLIYPVTVFCLAMSEMQVSHTCKQRAGNSICYVVYRPFSGVGWGELAPYINGYYFNTCYSTLFPLFFFFPFLSFGLSHLPNKLSSYVLFFLVNKRFQAEKAFNHKRGG